MDINIFSYISQDYTVSLDIINGNQDSLDEERLPFKKGL